MSEETKPKRPPRKRKPHAEKPGAPRKRKAPEVVEETYLPGMAPEKNERVHPRAIAYYNAMMDRVGASKEETDTREAMIESMKEEGLTFYQFGKHKVFLNAKDVVKVVEEKEKKARKKKGQENEED